MATRAIAAREILQLDTDKKYVRSLKTRVGIFAHLRALVLRGAGRDEIDKKMVPLIGDSFALDYWEALIKELRPLAEGGAKDG